MSESLKATDELSARTATHPRVSLADIEEAIESIYYVTGDRALGGATPVSENLHLLTMCIIVLKNRWIVLGKSAPASPENFDEEKGRTFAYDDAVRQIWPLMGFALKDRLADAAKAH